MPHFMRNLIARFKMEGERLLKKIRKQNIRTTRHSRMACITPGLVNRLYFKVHTFLVTRQAVFTKDPVWP